MKQTWQKGNFQTYRRLMWMKCESTTHQLDRERILMMVVDELKMATMRREMHDGNSKTAASRVAD
jgi:hypothetical protein